MTVETEIKSSNRAQNLLRTSLIVSFLLLVFSLGFMQPSVAVGGYQAVATDPIFLVTFFIWIIALATRTVRPRWNSLYLVLAPYLASMVLATAFSIDPGRSAIKLLGGIYLLGLAVLTLNIVTTVELARRTIYAWLAATAIVGLVSLVTLMLFYLDRTNIILHYTLSHYGTLPTGNYPRVRATFLNANMLANYLNVGLMLLLAAFKLNWIGKRSFVVLLVMVCAASALTISPGLGGLLLCVGIWFRIDAFERGLHGVGRVSLAAGIFAAAAFYIAVMVTSFNTLGEWSFELPNGMTVYSSERVSAWIAAMRTISEYPLFGKGIGLAAVDARSIHPGGYLHVVGDAHQSWLNFGAQTGLFGLLAIVLLSAFLFRRSVVVKFGGIPEDVLRTTFGIAFIGAFLYQGLSGSFEDARHLWVLIGLLAGFSDRRFSS